MFQQIFEAFEFAIKKNISFSHIDNIEHEIRTIIVNMNRKQIKSKFNIHIMYIILINFFKLRIVFLF